ncbi:MAG: hypothetical protein QOG04_1324 [Actinomycetota bacterium]|nr:hypothetical protein [Actinomycetota bacterium]
MLAAFLLVYTPSIATAQSSEPSSESNSITLIGQPVWHGPDDPLGLRLRIDNDGLSTLDGFRLQVRAYSPARSRSELHENFEVDPLRLESSSLPIYRLDQVIPAGTSSIVTIEEPISALSSVVAATDGGVYPITVTLTDSDGFTALDTITTQLLYFPEDVEVPLNVVLTWPLADLPSRAGGGVFVPDDTGDTSLERATADDGWLTGILSALEAPSATPLRLGIAPGARLIEELGDMADGFRRDDSGTTRTIEANDPIAEAAGDRLTRLRELLAEQRTQPILTPYALPDLTSIDDFEQLTAQLAAATSVLEQDTDVLTDKWLFPPAGRVDEVTLERLRSSDVAASTFFAEDALEPAVDELAARCREDFLGTPYTCPVKVGTASGDARGFVLDPELQQRFGALVQEPGNVRELQKLFAEIAMIWAELPGTEGRVIPLAVPPLWHPPPAIAARFVNTLADSPWIRSRTPRAGLHLGGGTIERDLVTELPPSRVEPEDSYLQTVDAATEVVESFARVRPDVGLVQRLRRDVLVSQSVLWWGADPLRLQQGAAYAANARDEAEEELGKISIGGRTHITLASKSGALPLVLQNGTDYPVTLQIDLESFDRDLELSERVIRQTFDPGATSLSVQASARASGIYPVGVRVEASDGYKIFETSISIRSSTFNQIALAITLGAFFFLVLFSALRGFRRRRLAATGDSAE